MSKLVMIKMVSAENCDRCAEVKQRIVDVAKKVGVKLAIQHFDSSDPDAIDLGIEFGLDDVPSFVANGKAFCGTGWKNEDLEKVMRA